MTEEEIVKHFIDDLLEHQVDIPEEFGELINEHFWDLV